MNFALILLAVTSFALGVLMTGLIKYQFSQHLLDVPNERSSHTQPTPRGGGLGFIVAFAITSAMASALQSNLATPSHQQFASPEPLNLWLILTPLVIVGLIDDQRGVPAGVRYWVQLVAAALIIACFGSFPQPWLTNLGLIGQITAIAFTVIGITALINFYNFMDGLDGLVAGVTAIQLSFLGYYLHQPIFWLLVAALLGFLWWNWSPAKIFMGDAGSTLLGASVAIVLLNTNNDPLQTWSALAITLPLTGDATYTLIRRLSRRENIFKAHRSHLYQRLQQAGWSHSQVVIAYITITGLIILAITSLGIIGSWLSLVGVMIAIAAGELYLRSKPSGTPSSKSSQRPSV